MYKKKKKSKIWLVLIMLLVCIGAGAAYWHYNMIESEAESSMAEVLPELESNQEYVYARITSILGNEMTADTYEDNTQTGSGTWLIPVGTDVVTKLGTTTSFSRLASGDYIRMLMQNGTDSQDILKIWIVN